ncbi:predicted protein [Sclerotinia sclerotiorum 1980 UF-70]|uniref:Uncharacterized protein n=1 Tax=Sclerotinia sclerotiorum (strain ATCC 18683 / 1980 / Ss-1) TaxID=665079 RepID=A7EV48_SCLS1|nr:predicted protein [Sclerotinia sclerotiorum 1980 UF-70]EDN93340.1 predicted protein [Sclerotinia sclerotiorum 1980 UF-70]
MSNHNYLRLFHASEDYQDFGSRLKTKMETLKLRVFSPECGWDLSNVASSVKQREFDQSLKRLVVCCQNCSRMELKLRVVSLSNNRKSCAIIEHEG